MSKTLTIHKKNVAYLVQNLHQLKYKNGRHFLCIGGSSIKIQKDKEWTVLEGKQVTYFNNLSMSGTKNCWSLTITELQHSWRFKFLPHKMERYCNIRCGQVAATSILSNLACYSLSYFLLLCSPASPSLALAPNSQHHWQQQRKSACCSEGSNSGKRIRTIVELLPLC